MSARIDLDELARRENEQTEWKENVADVDDVVETLSAFANDLQNLGGGYVVCGAKEAKDENGFPRLVRVGLTANRLKEVENTVLARCRARVSPRLAPLIEEIESDDPQRRILVFVQPQPRALTLFAAATMAPNTTYESAVQRSKHATASCETCWFEKARSSPGIDVRATGRPRPISIF